MNGEILSIETTEKLVAIQKAIEYMKNYVKVEPINCTTYAVMVEFKEVLKILGCDTNEQTL